MPTLPTGATPVKVMLPVPTAFTIPELMNTPSLPVPVPCPVPFKFKLPFKTLMADEEKLRRIPMLLIEPLALVPITLILPFPPALTVILPPRNTP